MSLFCFGGYIGFMPPPFKVDDVSEIKTLGAFFDMLARFDFEDQQRNGLVGASTSSVDTPSEEVLIQTKLQPRQ